MAELSVQSESRRCVLNAALEAEHTYIIIQAEAHTVKQQYKRVDAICGARRARF